MNALRTDWGAHAARVLAMASSPSRTLFPKQIFIAGQKLGLKVRFGEPPKPAREPRALPIHLLRRL